VKKADTGHIIVPIHREQGESRFPGWGGAMERVHEDLLPSHMASDILNITNRQGIQSYNIGTISTRSGYADSMNYQIPGGNADPGGFSFPSRFLARFYPGQATSVAGKVTFTGSGLDDLTLDTAVPLDEDIVITIDAEGAPDTFTWTHGGVVGNTGVAITGASQQIGTTGWYVTFAATTGHTDTEYWTIRPTSQAAQILRLAGAAGASAFQKWTGASWTEITGSLKGQWYPQWIVYDVPANPYFCWVDPVNGLHVYDGTDDVAQAIPKYNDTGDITGALWLAQVDGRLIVAGNWLDAGQADVLYFSAAGDYTKWESHNGGGQVPLYASSGMDQSQMKRITGMTVLHGQLIVFTEDSRFVVSGIGTANQTVRNYPGFGCFSGKAIVNDNNHLYWWSKDGAYEWNGNEPIEIGQPIMPELYSLKVSAAHKFFGFVYEGQWWTNAIRTDGAYRNFVFDFATRQWFIFNIPMVAAYTSLTGLVDAGYLYFSSPEAVSAKYEHYIYGVDPLNSYAAVYGDKVTGVKAARTATDIPAHWTSGRMDFGDMFKKDFWLLHARIAIANSTSIPAAAFTRARIDFNLNDADGFSGQLTFLETETTPYHALSFAGTDDVDNATQGTLVQVKLNVAGTKRLDLKRVYIEYVPSNIMEHET